jgi:hypothetical protein
LHDARSNDLKPLARHLVIFIAGVKTTDFQNLLLVQVEIPDPKYLLFSNFSSTYSAPVPDPVCHDINL